MYISEAEGRNFDGSMRYPSRFILDIDSSLLGYTEELSEELIADAKLYIDIRNSCMRSDDEKSIFEIGQRVKHKLFGEGTVIDVDTAQTAYIVQFDNMDTQRVISFRANMEKC